jgi:phenylacetaldehyde dehydrogenase
MSMNIHALDERLKPSASSFVSRPGRLLIDGAFVEAASGKTFAVHDPATGALLTQVAEAGDEDVDRAVAAARRAFEGPWRKLSFSERGQLLWKLGELIEQNSEEFAQIEALDGGKPISVARRVDVAWSIEMLRYMAGWATKITGQTVPFNRSGGDYFCYTTREPVGVVAQIIPFNFPLLIAVIKLAPALAAGCTVILKPAEQTPLSALRLGELVAQAGFPPGVVNILTGFGPTTGAALAAHAGVDAVAFTGSTAVGKKIVTAAAGNLKKVQLELGGKAPAVVFPDADLDRAIPGVSHGIFFNQGQTCCAGSRLFAHRKVFDRVLEGVCNFASRMRLGSALDEKTEMGPLVSDAHADRVAGYVRSGTDDGARIEVGGSRLAKDGGYFFPPTVLTGTRPDMKIVREEVFGPVLVAEPFDDDDLESVAKFGNDTVFGLSASVWTRNLSTAHKASRVLKAGTIWINCHNVFDGGLPFGGFKQSGWGREMGFEVLHNYTEVKTTITAL